MITSTVTAREMLRNHKEIIERVRKTKQPAIVVNQKKPQVAIVSIDDLEELRRLRLIKAIEGFQTLAAEIAQQHKDNPLPSDLSTKHNDYFVEAWEGQKRRT